MHRASNNAAVVQAEPLTTLPTQSGRLGVCFAVMMLTAAPSLGQAPSVRRLSPPDAVLDEGFTLVTSIRELSDGRVLIADRSENRLVIADSRLRTVSPIGRTGAGPGEFARISHVFSIGHDSTLVVDDGGARWLIVHREHIVATIPLHSTHFLSGYFVLKGVDAASRLLAISTAAGPGADAGRVDSMLLIMVSRDWRRRDTIAYLASPYPPKARQQDGFVIYLANPENRAAALKAQATMDEAAVYSDGSVAVVRRGAGRVDWYLSGGRRSVVAKGPNSGSWSPRGNEAASWTTPGTAGIVPSPDGNILVMRAAEASARETMYDVLDRNRVVGAISLAKAERLIGFGGRHAYVIATDPDGVQRLQRHPWP